MHSDVSCLYENDLKNICSKECSMYSHCRKNFGTCFMVLYVDDRSVVTIVAGECSEKKWLIGRDISVIRTTNILD